MDKLALLGPGNWSQLWKCVAVISTIPVKISTPGRTMTSSEEQSRSLFQEGKLLSGAQGQAGNETPRS